MRLPGSAQVLEARRRRALTLVQQGLSLNAAARRLGCAASSVMHWVKAHRQHGAAGLKVRSAPGRPRRLTARQEARLLHELLRGAQAHGYGTELWTTQRIARPSGLGSSGSGLTHRASGPRRRSSVAATFLPVLGHGEPRSRRFPRRVSRFSRATLWLRPHDQG